MLINLIYGIIPGKFMYDFEKETNRRKENFNLTILKTISLGGSVIIKTCIDLV